MEMQPPDGSFWKFFSEKYNDVVKSNYKNNSVLKMISFVDGNISDLNSYSLILVANLLEKEGLRMLPLKEILNYNLTKGFGVDLGLVLGNEKYPNEYLVKKLIKQVKEMKYSSLLDSPLVFKPSDLELISDKKSPEGIGFKIKEKANIFYAPQLKPENNKKRFNNVDDGRGMPVFDEKGSRTLYTRQGGLLKLSLSKYGDLCCWDDNLTKPNVDGKLHALNDSNQN